MDPRIGRGLTSPGSVLAWIPVIREIVGLVSTIVDRVRDRRKRRRESKRPSKQ